jgi:hypothetical protein
MKDLLYRIVGWDFIRMGKGIEARHERCADYWAPHLSCTKEFISKNITPGGKLAILGAGRLLDVDLPALLPLFSEIHLYDADPTALATWKRVSGKAYGKTVFGHIEDVTGSLREWSAGLSLAHKRGKLAEYLRERTVRSGTWEHQGFDGVISLNIIGQLPLYWRDRVLEISEDLSADEERALIDTMAILQTRHVEALHSRSCAWAIAITDTEYYTYQVDYPQWDVADALHGRTRELLNGGTHSDGATREGAWLWHLSPQFVESDTEGAIHRVEARVWRQQGEVCKGQAV